MGREDAGMWDSGKPRRGKQEHGTWVRGEAGTSGHRCDRQTAPEFCVEFVIYNFQWSRGRYRSFLMSHSKKKNYRKPFSG